eukprot:CAMPEP_0116573306 /NCGR_PEP_ID=MMETSP0397-20121206/18711_1 /TAXON_ID=216820 /ORGANISM="Cyclophora tenuis, Strain ECT3854" /LENGTH=42 /DNA_ID= /DNA_START= /DNA_END= /DNA_ORIENTATION=
MMAALSSLTLKHERLAATQKVRNVDQDEDSSNEDNELISDRD